MAAAAAPHAGTAGAFATFEGGGGYVYLVRQLGTHAPSATQRVSDKKRQHPLGRRGDERLAATCSPPGTCTATIQARLWYGDSKHFGPIQNLAKVNGRDAPRGRPRRRPARDRRVGRPARERGQHGPEGDRVGHLAQRVAAASCCRRSSSRRSRTRRSPPARSSRPPTRRPAAASSPGAAATPSAPRSSTAARSRAPQDLAPIPSSPDDIAAIGLANLVVSGERRRGGDDGRRGRRQQQPGPRRAAARRRTGLRPGRAGLGARAVPSPTRAPRSTRSPTSSSWPGGPPNPPPPAASRSPPAHRRDC